jgi:hypothetical protein
LFLATKLNLMTKLCCIHPSLTALLIPFTNNFTISWHVGPQPLFGMFLGQCSKKIPFPMLCINLKIIAFGFDLIFDFS